MSTEFIFGVGFTVLGAALGLIWWEIRVLRQNSHAMTNRVTSLVGKLGLLEHRVGKLEKKS